jgi:hypothetical protein
MGLQKICKTKREFSVFCDQEFNFWEGLVDKTEVMVDVPLSGEKEA